ncbi:MAG: HIT family protein [Candidatus Shapirobacteria bacterium]|jgi:diadenosine tetraphosphate (Ap4A) HIT family hydrolase
MDQCDFCDSEVLKKQGVYEDEYIIAIYPQKPIIYHHFIIFPKRHSQLVTEMTAKEIAAMNKVFERIYKNYKKENKCIGYNLSSNNGSPKVGQTVAHCHFHIYLRFEDEKVSPYKVMGDMSLRDVLSEDEWELRKKKVSEIINNNEV